MGLAALLTLGLSACGISSVPFIENGLQEVVGNFLESDFVKNDSVGDVQNGFVFENDKEDENATLGNDEILLINESKQAISYAYITESGSNVWSDDLLDSRVLGKLEETSFTMPQGNGVFDFRLQGETGDIYEFKSLVLDANETLVFTNENGGTLEHYSADGGFFTEITATLSDEASGSEERNGPEVSFGNGLPEDVTQLYMSPSDDPSWGENHLGTEMLYAGNAVGLRIEDGVYYDVNVELEDGTVAEFYQMPLYVSDSLNLIQSGNRYIIEVVDMNDMVTGSYYDVNGGTGAGDSFDTQYYGST